MSTYVNTYTEQPKKHLGLLTALIIILCLTIIGGVGLGLYFYFHDDEDETVCTVSLNDNAFYVGTYYRSSDQDTGDYFKNRLYINIYQDGEAIYRLSYYSDDFVSAESLGLSGDFTNIQGRYTYGDIGFVDLSSLIKTVTGGFGLDYWTYLNPTGNYIELYTEWTAGPIMSNPVIVNESGVYLINIPTEDGCDVDYQHSSVYINYCEGGDL